jgi:formate dehydrogenase subunit delta
MDPIHLAKMANDIAAFFAAYPPDEAQREIASHLTRFWEPRMRTALLDAVAAGRVELVPLARAALDHMKAPIV